MANGNMLLSKVVSVKGRFIRSVHLERDYTNNAISDYYVTAATLSALRVFSSSLVDPASRAISLIGPYGGGKSAFCVRLAQTLRNKALRLDTKPALDIELASTGMVPVLVVGSRVPLLPALVDGLYRSLDNPYLADIRELIPGRRDSDRDYTPKQVADLYLVASRAAKRCGKGGIVLIADEVGKFLEYAALDRANGDIFVLQELAEAACRSGDDPLVVLTVMHQPADSYAQNLGRDQRAEWMKVGERFSQVPFYPADAERIDLVRQAIEHGVDLEISRWFDKLAERCVDLNIAPSSINERFPEVGRAAFPLHPLTLIALPALFRRIGQSHRSMFSFLSSDEPHSLGRYITETPYDPNAQALYTLDMLFEYAVDIMAGGWVGSSVLRQWVEAIDIVENADKTSPTAKRVLRCVALLSLIRDSRLKATEAVLALALASSESQVSSAISELVRSKLITYSRSREQYRLLETGDIDVEAVLESARITLPASTALHVAEHLCPLQPVVARRHSYETGALRGVKVVPCSASQLPQLALTGDGLRLLMVVAANVEEAETADRFALDLDRTDVVVCVGVASEILKDAAADVAAAERVRLETPELSGDRLARKELALRRAESETRFKTEWDRLFGFGNISARWYYLRSEQPVQKHRDLFALLSTMADKTYPQSPRLRNELINRASLSAAAAAGRRTLIEVMLKNEHEPRLGLKAFPPELSMYECVLKTSGIHVKTADGTWRFVKPSVEDPAGIAPVWNKIEDIVFQESPAPHQLTDIYETLGNAPFGVTDGIKPIVIAAFLIANKNEASLYREGTFLPEPSIADFEVLLRRPELFALSGCRVSGDRQLIVDRMARGFGTAKAVVPVVRAMISMVRGLPEHAWKTQKLSSEVIALREAFYKVKSPERLLFHSLPAALKLPLVNDTVTADGVEEYFKALNAAIGEWSQCMPLAIRQSRDELLVACGYDASDDGWSRFKLDAGRLEPRTTDQRLRPLLARASSPGDNGVATESVLALIASRPTKSWTDLDRSRFSEAAKAFGILYREAAGDNERTVPVLAPSEEAHRRETEARVRLAFGEQADPKVIRAVLIGLLRELNEGIPND